MRRPLRPVLAQAPHGLEHDRHLLDRVDGAALLGRELMDAGVAGAPAHGDARQQAAAAGDPHDEAARFRDDRGVGLQRAGGEQPAGAGRLLLGDRVDDHVARERDAELSERAGCHHHARHTALHVAGAAAVEPPVAHDRAERIGLRPVAPRLGGDNVDVPVEQQRASASAAAEARDELWAAVERELLGHHRVRPQRRRVRLVQLDLGAVAAQQRGEVVLERALLARRRAGCVGHGVEGDELARERDERVAPAGHGVDHATLFGRELHDAIP